MQKSKIFVKNIITAIAITALALVMPLAAYAQSATETATTTASDTDSTASPTIETEEPAPESTPPPTETPPETASAATDQSTGPGPTEPTGADAETYTYNEQTGLWENDYYTWNPVTKQTRPKTQQTYSYNPETDRWDTTQWQYSPETGRYVPNTVSVAQPPAGATISNTGPDSTNTITSDGPLDATIDGTGPSSSNSILSDSTGTGMFDLFFDASISHTVNSTATSGDASVLQNTTAGGATSGDATTIANILNMLQSSWGSVGSGDLTTFLANIDGDVVGDLYIDPGQLTGKNLGVSNGLEDITINAETNGQINNDIVLEATSGDATVAGNTTAGDATTGSATAMANVMNLINSSIAAGQSFVGTININGNLEGDILLPDWLENYLLASADGNGGETSWLGSITNTGPDSTNTIDQDNSGSLDADLDNNFVINNDISATATSGSTLVDSNTTAGDAVSGDASTNVTLFNLTGRQIVGSNSLLVFVNVLGEWVGLIVDAPEGSTAAAFGGGITANSPLASGQDVDIDATTNSEINNNISVTATSGDAAVRNNTTAGGATSGDAAANVNVLNIAGSQLALSDWFGVLFINVFGSWHGSFGVDTAMGDRPAAAGTGNTQKDTPDEGLPAVFRFKPKESRNQPGRQVAAAQAETGGQDDLSVGVARSAQTPPIANASDNAQASSATSSSNASQDITAPNWLLTLLVGGLASLAAFKGEWFLFMFRQRSGGNPSA